MFLAVSNGKLFDLLNSGQNILQQSWSYYASCYYLQCLAPRCFLARPCSRQLNQEFCGHVLKDASPKLQFLLIKLKSVMGQVS